MNEREMLEKQQPEGERTKKQQKKEAGNQTEVGKKTKMNPEEENMGRWAALRLRERERLQ